MPKARIERVIPERSNDKWEAVEITTAAGGEDKGTTKVVYMRPKQGEKQGEYLLEYVLANRDKPVDINYFYPDKLDIEDEEDAAEEGETTLNFFARFFVNSLDRKARADAYKSLAQESTMITAGDQKADIMTFPVDRLVRGINGYRSQVETRMWPIEQALLKESDPAKKAAAMAAARKDAEKAVKYGPWKTAGRLLVDQGKARENASSGMLEVVA